MSEPIPESIPTSADPRSKRATKKRALSPHTQTATQISSLFSKPDQVIPIPSSNSSITQYNVPLPPEIVQNVQGSSAGAGSGEFHVYKASRRREYERLRDMESQVEKEKEDERWEKEKREREEKDREVTRRKREKRERLKQKKGKAGKNISAEIVEYGLKDGKLKPRVVLSDDTKMHIDEGNCIESKPEDQSLSLMDEIGIVIHDDD